MKDSTGLLWLVGRQAEPAGIQTTPPFPARLLRRNKKATPEPINSNVQVAGSGTAPTASDKVLALAGGMRLPRGR